MTLSSRHALMRRLTFLLAVLGLAASTGGAQSPSPQTRQIALPDTLGANFSIGDSASVPGALTDFDFLVGLWHFRFQGRNADGSWGSPFTGHWWAERKRTPNGFIEDRWRPDNSGASLETSTYTYRVFNPRRKLWEMQGVGSENGSWEPGLSWSDGSNRYVIQRDGATIMRIRYFNISDNSFLWRADQSRDGGKTWRLDWWTMSATRIAK
jgi:hypothetical protein